MNHAKYGIIVKVLGVLIVLLMKMGIGWLIKLNLSEIQSVCFIEYKRNGYLDMWNNSYIINKDGKFELDFRKTDIAELGLIATEITEAQEVIRKYKTLGALRAKLRVECADIIIRTLNYMSRKDMLAEPVILRKTKINMKRGFLHGNIV